MKKHLLEKSVMGRVSGCRRICEQKKTGFAWLPGLIVAEMTSSLELQFQGSALFLLQGGESHVEDMVR